MSLLKKCMELDPNVRKPLDIGLIWEGNYWDDQDVHDCCDVDWETCEILVRKIASALHLPTAPTENFEEENSKILIFLPKVMQLPLTILAAYRAGMVTILMDPLTTKHSTLESIIKTEQPKLLITVDAFWQGQELIEVKNRIENLPGMDDVTLLVIRHVAPNQGVPPPKKHFPARRPSYSTQLDSRNGKDWEWSTVMAGITVGEYGKTDDGFKWKDGDTVMNMVHEEGRIHSIRHIQLLDAFESKSLEAKKNWEKVGGVENVMALDHDGGGAWKMDTVVELLFPWYMGKTMTLYEGPLDYPDSSRLAQIISKHNVNVIMGSGASENYSIPNPEYLKFFPVPTLKMIDTPKFPEISKWLQK